MEEIELVGGPQDGTRMVTPAGRNDMLLPVAPDPADWSAFGAPTELLRIETVRYRRRLPPTPGVARFDWVK
jgi:hypothetical protein